MFYVDMELVVFSIKNTSTFIYLDYDIYRYYIGRDDQSISANSMLKNRLSHEAVLRRLIEFCENNHLDQARKIYTQKVITLMLNTHYIIYCGGAKKTKSMTNEIRKFDKFLFQASYKYYNDVSKRFSYIKYFRKTNFFFIAHFPKLFRKYINFKFGATVLKVS